MSLLDKIKSGIKGSETKYKGTEYGGKEVKEGEKNAFSGMSRPILCCLIN